MNYNLRRSSGFSRKTVSEASARSPANARRTVWRPLGNTGRIPRWLNYRGQPHAIDGRTIFGCEAKRWVCRRRVAEMARAAGCGGDRVLEAMNINAAADNTSCAASGQWTGRRLKHEGVFGKPGTASAASKGRLEGSIAEELASSEEWVDETALFDGIMQEADSDKSARRRGDQNAAARAAGLKWPE